MAINIELASQIKKCDPSKVKLLLVEDNRFLREVLRNMFVATGVTQLLEAGTLREAVQYLQSFDLDVVLLDLRLPDGDGFELLRHIEGEHKSLPVVINSYQYSVPLLVRCFRTGAAGYFTKGENKNALIAGVLRAAIGEQIWSTEQMTQIAEMESLLSHRRPAPQPTVAEHYSK